MQNTNESMIVHVLLLLTLSVLFDSSKSIREHSERDRNSENDEKSEIWKRVAVSNPKFLWDNGVIPYEIGTNFSDPLRTAIIRGMDTWESKSCIKFVQAEPIHEYRVQFTNTDVCGCCSVVGKRLKVQGINLNEKYCDYVSVLHETAHTMGFYHEQNRPDRDQFIKVFYENIQKEHAQNYMKLTEEEADTLGFSYDFDSILHYPAYNTFSIAGKATMQALNKNISLKNKGLKLSKTDIAAANKLYRCPDCYVKLKQRIARIDLSNNGLASKNGYCQWFYNGNPGEFIHFIVENVNISKSNKCSSSYLQFQDGYLPTSPIIDRICGKIKSTKLYKTDSNHLLVTYKSSANSKNEELSLIYKTTCNGTIKGDYGRLQNPNFEEPYPFSPMCQWVLMVPSNARIVLTFQTFHIKRSENCQSDYLEIIDGSIDSGNKLLEKHCGDKLPGVIVSSSNTLTVKYESKGKSMENRFSANFSKEINECELPEQRGCDICIDTIGSYQCECSEGRIWVKSINSCENIINTCGGTIQNNERVVIASPSYPNPFPSNSNCTWTILQKNLEITYILMDINESKNECSNQIILTTQTLRKVYCDFHGTTTLENVSNLKIQFISKQNTNRPGFKALVEPL